MIILFTRTREKIFPNLIRQMHLLEDGCASILRGNEKLSYVKFARVDGLWKRLCQRFEETTPRTFVRAFFVVYMAPNRVN